MTIGLPKGFLYYRYHTLWKTFFNRLGHNVITSDDTNKEILTQGINGSIDECCLPLKAYLGHVSSLIGKCDYILVPRFERLEKDKEFCVRLWGIQDIVKNTFRISNIIGYNINSLKSEEKGFIQMGRKLGIRYPKAISAYRYGRDAQYQYDIRQELIQNNLLHYKKPKILIASKPYLMHDKYIGGVVPQIITELGGIPLYSDRCDKEECVKKSKRISHDLYWILNKELLGSIEVLKAQINGVILLSSFPCGTDSLANELALRKVKDIPIIQILLDEHQSEIGLQTRLESFMDIITAKPEAEKGDSLYAV